MESLFTYSLGRFDREPPSGHLTETTDAGTNTQGSLSSELDGNQTEGLISGGDQSELSTTEDVGRESSKLGLREDTSGVEFHELAQLQRGELAVEINNGTNGNQLNLGVGFEDRGEHISNKINLEYVSKVSEPLDRFMTYALLQRPTTDEDEKLGFRVDLQAGPFLSLSTEVTTAGFPRGVDLRLLLLHEIFLVPVGGIRRVGVGQLADLGETPEDRVTGERTVTVLLGDTDSAEAVLVDTEVTGGSVEKVENCVILGI